MTALVAELASPASQPNRFARWLETAIALRYPPPPTGADPRQEEEAMMQVALICAVHF
jgi:hypothetical protein